MRHCNELCLVFRKVIKKKNGELIGDYTRFRMVVNQIFSVPGRIPSTKPFQLYEFIEKICDTNKGGLLEIFSRPHNQREGWVGVGNEAISFL
jgi:N6-adenosine-specific RNA methylase IME4